MRWILGIPALNHVTSLWAGVHPLCCSLLRVWLLHLLRLSRTTNIEWFGNKATSINSRLNFFEIFSIFEKLCVYVISYQGFLKWKCPVWVPVLAQQNEHGIILAAAATDHSLDPGLCACTRESCTPLFAPPTSSCDINEWSSAAAARTIPCPFCWSRTGTHTGHFNYTENPWFGIIYQDPCLWDSKCEDTWKFTLDLGLCACTRVSCAPLFAHSFNLQLRRSRSGPSWEAANARMIPCPFCWVQTGTHTSRFNPWFGITCQDSQYRIRNARKNEGSRKFRILGPIFFWKTYPVTKMGVVGWFGLWATFRHIRHAKIVPHAWNIHTHRTSFSCF